MRRLIENTLNEEKFDDSRAELFGEEGGGQVLLMTSEPAKDNRSAI